MVCIVSNYHSKYPAPMTELVPVTNTTSTIINALHALGRVITHLIKIENKTRLQVCIDSKYWYFHKLI